MGSLAFLLFLSVIEYTDLLQKGGRKKTSTRGQHSISIMFLWDILTLLIVTLLLVITNNNNRSLYLTSYNLSNLYFYSCNVKTNANVFKYN